MTQAPTVSPIGTVNEVNEVNEVNCWELAGIHEGREVLCTTPKSFLNYLRSEGTHLARAREKNVGLKPYVDLEAEGPVADDGERLYVRYRLTKGDFHERLCGSEQAILLRFLGALRPENCQPFRDGQQMVRDCLIKGYVRL